MDNETKQAFESIEARMDAMETRILERVEAAETRLLTAFMGWGQSIDLKLKAVPLIEARMNNVEDRITALERKNLQRGL
jgi:hypothetical protein